MSLYIKSIIFFLLSIVCSALNDILAKYVGDRLHPAQVSFLRFFYSTITLIVPIFYYGTENLKTSNLKIHILRGSMLFLGILSWIYGLNYVQITTATVMSFSIPLFTLALGSFFLKEKIIWQRWCVTIIGFIGIFITLSPSRADFDSMSLIFIGSSLIFASLDIINKIFISKESMLGMMFYSSITTLVLSAPFAFNYWKTPTLFEISLLFILGISANLILYFILKAFNISDATALAPYRYLELFITSILGFLIFNEVPNIHTLYGAAIIIPSTLFIIYSETKKKS